MLRRSTPEEPEWYRTATRSVLLAEETARTDSRQDILAQQQAYEQQQAMAAQMAQQQAYAQQHAYQAQLAHQQAQHQAWLQQQQYSAHYVTAHAQVNPTPRPTLRTWLLSGVVALGTLFLALLVAVSFGYSYGIILTLLSGLAALIPLGIVLPLFLWLDRFEAEPWRYLLTAFLYGALFSTLVAGFFNGIALGIFGGMTDAESAQTLTAVISAPLTEETMKGLFILLMWLAFRKQFNGFTDGIVYAGVVAAGFAFVENIQYLGNAYVDFGPQVFTGTFFMRGILTPFLHPMFTAMTGIGIGIAATSRALPVKFIAPFLGWCVAVLLHGLWNLAASSGGEGVLVGLGVGFVCFVAFVSFVVWMRRREGRVIGDHLRPYADTGWISYEEVSMLASMKARRGARTWAKVYRGSGGLKSMRSFQDSASELALLRYRMINHVADQQSLFRERVLLDSMTARRREFAGVG